MVGISAFTHRTAANVTFGEKRKVARPNQQAEQQVRAEAGKLLTQYFTQPAHLDYSNIQSVQPAALEAELLPMVNLLQAWTNIVFNHPNLANKLDQDFSSIAQAAATRDPVLTHKKLLIFNTLFAYAGRILH